MVLGLSSKNKKGASVHVDYLINIHEIKPWPPSQSLRSLRSVVILWENGERNSGSTNIVTPTLGSVIGEGKIEFNESFKLPVTLLRDASVRTKDSDTFLKNVLEFNLYEPRREKTHQLLATATIDLADYGIVKDSLSISAPVNSKRSYRNTAQPVLFLTIQKIDRRRTNSSPRNRLKDVSKNGGESVSAFMNEEYNEEAEIASFTDDDISSHSSLAVSSSTLESNGGLSTRTEEEEQERVNDSVRDNAKGNGHDISLEMKGESSTTASEREPGEVFNRISSRSSSVDLSSEFSSPVDARASAMDASNISSVSEPEDNANVFGDRFGDSVKNGQIEIANESPPLKGKGQHGNGEALSKSFPLDYISGEMDAEQYLADELQNASSQASDCNQDTISNLNCRGDRLRNVKSVRSSLDIAKSSGVSGVSGNTRNIEIKEAKVYPKGTRDTVLENKIKDLESKVRMLEGELREAAATEAALYSVVAEHGSSASKVHAPARRLSRLYLHACRENPPSRRANAAKSAVSGIVLIAKACGNDVPRLTFWLSNSIVLRAIISQVNGEEELPVSAGPHVWRPNTPRETKKKQSPLKWKESPLPKKDSENAMYERFGNWDDPNTFASALEKVEAWIFSRIVESIWWQTLTPRMQSAATRAFDKANGSGSKKNFGRTSSSMNQEQGDFSLELWKKAFKDACERLCPLRATGHQCGCLPVPARLIMEQCVARLDVAMFNAILRDSDDHIPTDPVSDPIGDSRVLPIPAGRSSFGAGAQLKNTIGNWSRWLTDLFGIDDDDVVDNEDNSNDDDDERPDRSFKSFHLLNALSDLMMLPKDMLLNSSVRKEVCPAFGAPLIRRVLNNFVPDEFCPDPVPDTVLKALETQEPEEAGEESITNYPCTAAPPAYSPPSAISIAGIIGEFGSQSQLRRSGSSVMRKSYTSDDELDELNSPLALILQDTSRATPPATKSGWVSKASAAAARNTVRYELLRDIWMKGE